MRKWIKGLAVVGVALSVAAPNAMANGSGHEPDTDPSTRATRLLAAADNFDRKATQLRGRAAKLRATGLELRQEADELLKDAAAPTDDPAQPKQGGSDEAPTDQATDDPCAWDGEDDLGVERQGDAGDSKEPWDDGGSAKEEACELVRMADKLEQRADAFDAAAKRMEYHAAKLREKAARVLGEGGQSTSKQLLERAAKLRTQATELRASADALRDAAFEDSGVDDEAVAKVRRLELRAAVLDARANRLEARAARAAA